jgi:hypothetical protein
MSRLTKFVTYAFSAAAVLSVTTVAEPAAAAVAPSSVRSVAADRPIGMVDDARAALETCVFYTRGDFVHVSSTEPQAASGHGWWTNGDCPTPLADVSVRLQLLKNGTWTDVAWGSKVVPSGGGAGNRATARVNCRTIAWNQWRSVIDVDLLGMFDTTDVLITQTRGLFCGL